MVNPPKQESLLIKWSLGRVAENKALSTKQVEIWPTEIRPYVEGEINTNTERTEHRGVDAEGNAYSCSVESCNTVVATWHPNGDNRISAPDVRRGERVQIWKYADSDEYWWTSQGLDPHLRRLETVQTAYSATKDESTTELTPDNSYYHEISTHRKTITGGTSKANGEPFAYKYQIDAGNGNAMLQDDDGNSFSMDSKERELILKNKDGCSVTISKGNMTLKVPETFTLDAKNAIFIIAILFKVTAQTIFMSAAAEYTLKAATLLMNGVSNIIQGTSFNVQAVATFVQAAAFNAAITHLNKNIGATHTHSGVQSGTSNSGPVV